MGKSLDLDGPNYVKFPQWVEINFGEPLRISRWRLWSGPGGWSTKDAQLEVDGKAIAGSTISNEPGTVWLKEAAVSEAFESVTTATVRITIPGTWATDESTMFQCYVNEIQFFVGEPTPSTFACKGGKCVPDPKGLPKDKCASMCDPTYQCIANTCVAATTGVSLTDCQTACHAN
jgi:hypothetical protein